MLGDLVEPCSSSSMTTPKCDQSVVLTHKKFESGSPILFDMTTLVFYPVLTLTSDKP